MKPTPSSFLFTSLDQQMQADIRAEQMRMFISNTPMACIFGSLLAVLLAVFLSHYVDLNMVYGWLGFKLLVFVPRVIHAIVLHKRKVQFDRKDHLLTLWMLCIDGISWGIAWPIFLPHLDHQSSMVLGCAFIGLVSVGSFTLHVYALGLVLYSVPILLPGIVLFALQNNVVGWFMGTGGAIFLYILTSIAKRSHSDLTEMLWRRFSMARILAENEQSLYEAARQNNIKSQFVATMSHELRTPLHGILGLTRMLINKHQDHSSIHQLNLLEKSGQHLLMLINHLLDFSRIEAGYLTIESKPFKLHALLLEAMGLTAINAQNKGLAMTHSLDVSPEAWVEGDASKYTQILLNLIGNAIKFTSAGSVHLEAQHDPQTGEVIVRVSDTGIGMALKDMVSVFEPYKQAHSASGSNLGGTGLGLTIAREMSRAMNGDITCESIEGVGSTFIFKAILPTWQPAPDTDFSLLQQPSPALSKPQLDGIQLKGHVLLVEDNEVNALIVDLQLKRAGLTVDLAKNGQEALERLCNSDQARPDVVLMDCQMPLLDGFEATQRLRLYEAKQNLSRLPVIALTASAMAEDSERCFDAGMDAHLPKPFKEEELVALLINYLQSSHNYTSSATY